MLMLMHAQKLDFQKKKNFLIKSGFIFRAPNYLIKILHALIAGTYQIKECNKEYHIILKRTTASTIVSNRVKRLSYLHRPCPLFAALDKTDFSFVCNSLVGNDDHHSETCYLGLTLCNLQCSWNNSYQCFLFCMLVCKIKAWNFFIAEVLYQFKLLFPYDKGKLCR